MAMVGGLKESQPINDEAKEIALKVKADVESKAGTTFSTYNPVEFATQLVAGTNFFIKIDVGEGKYIVARIYRDLQKNLSVHSVQTNKLAGDAITYF